MRSPENKAYLFVVLSGERRVHDDDDDDDDSSMDRSPVFRQHCMEPEGSLPCSKQITS